MDNKMKSSKWIWCDNSQLPNQYAQFIKEFNANVYSFNGELHIESLGQYISVYTIDGLCVYSTHNTSNGVVIRGLKDIVFVKVDNEIYKIFVKSPCFLFLDVVYLSLDLMLRMTIINTL